MKVPVLADIVRSVEKHAIRQTLDSIWIVVFEDWSVLRRFQEFNPESMGHNVLVFEYRTEAEDVALEQPIPTGRVMSVMEWVHQCPEPMAWRDDESDIPLGKTWWGVVRTMFGHQATTQFVEFTDAEEYYNSLPEAEGMPKQLIKLEVAREREE